MNQEASSNQEKKSNKKQWIALVIALCFLAASLVYRQDKIAAMNNVSINNAENSTPEEIFENEIKVMNLLADKFDEISKDMNKVDELGQPVMDLVSKWLKIKEMKNTLSAEEVAGQTKNYKEEIELALSRLQYSSMPIPLYKGGQNLMDQVGKALGALFGKKAKASADKAAKNLSKEQTK